MTLLEIMQYCRAEAISTSLAPSYASLWRNACRAYSGAFNTRLVDVLDMDPEHVFLNLYEDRISKEDLEDEDVLNSLMEDLYRIEDPNYDNEKEEEISNFIKEAELEELDRLRDKKPIHPKIDSEKETSLPKPKELPKSGGINLSYLDREESGGHFEE